MAQWRGKWTSTVAASGRTIRDRSRSSTHEDCLCCCCDYEHVRQRVWLQLPKYDFQMTLTSIRGTASLLQNLPLTARQSNVTGPNSSSCTCCTFRKQTVAAPRWHLSVSFPKLSNKRELLDYALLQNSEYISAYWESPLWGTVMLGLSWAKLERWIRYLVDKVVSSKVVKDDR